MALTKAEQFFYDHAGYSYDPATETEEQGRERCARNLAAAEAYADELDWTYSWEYDESGCSGCSCDSEDCPCSSGKEHETLVCTLWRTVEAEERRNGRDMDNILASLGGICGATREYRRVVEAELASEAMNNELVEAERISRVDQMLRECYAL